MIKTLTETPYEYYDLSEPKGYEYDSSTKSVVLQRGYVYNVYYEGKKTDVVDLTVMERHHEPE